MYVIFDIGGTNTRVATSSDLVSIDNVRKFATPLDYNEGLRMIKDSVVEVLENNKVLGVAGGIRGPLNAAKTGIISEVILTDWVGKHITTDISDMFNAPTYLENDTAIVGLGEVHYGTGREYEIVAYHTISSGVGGARYVNGCIDIARVGFEPGHQILDFDRSFLSQQEKPTLENLVSGSALQRARGVRPYEISQNDEIWPELAMRLAAGLRNTIAYWSPDVIVLGGSMIVGNPRILLEDIRRYTEGIMEGFMPCPPIFDAQLGDDGGLYGAMAILKQSQP